MATRPHRPLIDEQIDNGSAFAVAPVAMASSAFPESQTIHRVFPIRLKVGNEELAISTAKPPSAPYDLSNLTINGAVLPFQLTNASPVVTSTAIQEPEPEPKSFEVSGVPFVTTSVAPEKLSALETRYVTNKFNLDSPDQNNPSPNVVEGEQAYRCEDEPIHIPGAIQRFGALVAIKEDIHGHYIVRIASENTGSVLGLEPESLFNLECFTDALRSSDRAEFVVRAKALRTNVLRTNPNIFPISLISPQGEDVSLFCAMHLTDTADTIICEFEIEGTIFGPDHPPDDGLPNVPVQVVDHQAPSEAARHLSSTSQSQPLHTVDLARKTTRLVGSMDLFHILSEMQVQMSTATTLSELLDIIVGMVYELTGFHRVMIYQFDEQAAGCVQSEIIDPRASTDIYRGLHFPASDIPQQARDLYLVNTVRILYDREQETARLVCRTLDDATTPLDLKHSYLRAMSPVHLRYLANIGVRASMSISLVNDGKLWGLIACHNYGSSMRVSLPVRELCRGLGNFASSDIGKLIYAARIMARKALSQAPPKTQPSLYIAASSVDLLSMFAADFGFLVIKGEARTIGQLLAYNESVALLQYIRQENFSKVFSSHSIRKDCPHFSNSMNLAIISGMLVIPLNPPNADFLVFFRKGVLKEISWAGNPYEKANAPGRTYLEPRSSFQRWSEQVVGTSREWTEDQVESAGVLATLYGRFIEVYTWLPYILLEFKLADQLRSLGDHRSSFPSFGTSLFQASTNYPALPGRQKEAIVQKNRMTRLLIQNAGHEVRTPLSSIINYLEVALEDTLDEGARMHLQRSLQASKSLVFAVNDLLNLTEVEDAVYNMHQDYVDLKAMIRSVVLAFKPEITRKNLEIVIDADQTIPSIVKSDPTGLRQVVSNLLANAIQRSEVGRINISLRCISTINDHVLTEISIQDEGCGLAEFQLDSIFQDFEKILDDEDSVNEVSTSSNDANFLKTQNTVIGLGLALTARFVRLNNGQISMSSAGLGKGVKVSITIPFHKASIQPSLAATLNTTQSLLPTPPNINDRISESRTSFFGPLQSPSVLSDTEQSIFTAESPSTPISPLSESSNFQFDKLNILVAEDNPLNSRLLQTRLSRKGHGVQVSVDGQSCANTFKQNPMLFDIILMDIQMPLVDGIESTRIIREFERSTKPPTSPKATAYGRIPIIAVSASLVERAQSEYLAAGFDGWITKPINFQRLERIIAAVPRWVGDVERRKDLVFGRGNWEEGGWFLA
ncbi:related to phytochrome [Phialocephala subalpina]|uniref:Related to phytochrome n=1 Tax=Phialocephala subalpina TaxID=576137 RepID=A0A1L7X366_9HELO|nr:related to phytochrome [Phialocephala subalpina]